MATLSGGVRVGHRREAVDLKLLEQGSLPVRPCTHQVATAVSCVPPFMGFKQGFAPFPLS